MQKFLLMKNISDYVIREPVIKYAQQTVLDCIALGQVHAFSFHTQQPLLRS